MNRWICGVGASVLLTGTMINAEPLRTGTVVLTLVGGVETPAPHDRSTRDMELELTLKDGTFAKPVWGYAVYFNRADHEGEVTSAEGDRLTVKLKINRDKWYPASAGVAEYAITMNRHGDAFTGSYTGTFVYPGIEKRTVQGAVTGMVYPSWTEPPTGFKKLEPNEHPRLIFRKADLPQIKKRLETPEGKAIMARFLAMLPVQHATMPKNEWFLPAGYGLAYQLTGDKAHAVKAKEIIESKGLLAVGGKQDIHFGPEAQAIAITLDLCYDGWDAKFRQSVIDNLAKRMVNLFKGDNIGTYAPNPWHNHNGIRAPSAGLAAICLLGEKVTAARAALTELSDAMLTKTEESFHGEEIAGLERMIHILARDTRRYFQFNGVSNTGWCLEGAFYKRMTWNSGPGHMIHAYRTALGGDLMAGWPGHWTILGEWMQQPPHNNIAGADGLGDGQSSGLWPVGLVTVPDPMKAGARWLYDHAYGLQGNKTFGILWAYHAGYVLMNYPFDVPAKPPSESLPWVAPDPTGGRWIFRKPWQDGKDTLVVLHLRSGIQTGCHYERSGRTWDMQLFALGRLWLGDRGFTEDTGPGNALPLTSNPMAFNGLAGATTTYWHTTDDGKAILSFDMDNIYMQALAKGAKPSGSAKTALYPRLGAFADFGISAKRQVALDLTGKCGAPVLFVIRDQYQGANDLRWKLKLAVPGKVDGNVVTAGDPAAENLRCTFVGTKTPTLTADIIGTGTDEYFAIITVQNGAAPEVKQDGDKVTVGGQSIRFDGTKLVME